ncbi:MAG TPA: WXG100 family type VII secretion target [Amycolatopsis sp.]|jgi:WXG100 family type VII secretion target|nr:WXG100 family type VII secretion target [Amycolatopsis sp.]
MTEYSINFGSVQNAIDTLDACGKQISAALTQLEQEAAQQLSDWSGQAQANYQTYKSQWDTAAQNMSDLAVQGSGTLSDMHDLLKSTESAISNQWG